MTVDFFDGRGMKFLDVTTAPFFAEAGVAGGGDAIQDAIDAYFADPDTYYAVWIPPGSYQITKPLRLFPLAGGFSHLTLIGAGTSFATQQTGLGQTIIRFVGDGTGNEKILPMLLVMGGRGHYFQGIMFVAGNPAPFDVGAANGHASIFINDFDDWSGSASGIRTNPRSPQCVLVIDPFTDGYPDGDIANAYPGYEAFYTPPFDRGSSSLTFQDCSFQGGYIGTAVSPPGPNGAGVEVLNAGNINFDRCFWQYNTIHYSAGQNQARSCEIRSARMFGSFIAIDTEHIGPGGNPGIPPAITGASDIGNAAYILNINNRVTPFNMKGTHIESCASMGRVGIGFATTNQTAIFEGILYNTITPVEAGAPAGTPPLPFDFAVWGTAVFKCCTLGRTGADYLLRFWQKDDSALVFEDCCFMADDVNDRVPVGFNDPNNNNGNDNVHMTRILTRNTVSGRELQVDPETEGAWTTGEIDGGAPGATVTVVSVDDTTGTVALADTSALAVGDLVRIRTTTPNGYQPAVYPSTLSITNYSGVVGRITAIDPNVSFTIGYLPQGFPFGLSLRLGFFRWTN